MRHARLLAALLFAARVSASAHAQDSSRDQALPEIPPTLQPAVARAEQGMNALQSALLTRLREQMASGGPARAVSVCRDEAQVITARIAREQGIALGRTSHKLRNPSNSAPAWASGPVRAGEGSKADGQGIRVFDLGDRIGVLRPIGFIDMCASCHGAPAAIPDAVQHVIDTAYPRDAATGFVPGDLRGWLWAEVGKP
jgi:hypothetical protein